MKERAAEAHFVSLSLHPPYARYTRPFPSPVTLSPPFHPVPYALSLRV